MSRSPRTPRSAKVSAFPMQAPGPTADAAPGEWPVEAPEIHSQGPFDAAAGPADAPGSPGHAVSQAELPELGGALTSDVHHPRAAHGGEDGEPASLAVGRQHAMVAQLRPRVGEVLVQANKLAVAHIQAVLDQQARAGGRFGEVAIAMGLLDASDLLWALSHQASGALGRIDSLTSAHPDLILTRRPFGAAAEFIRDLRSQLLSGVLGAAAGQRRALSIVSTNAGDGKSFIAANLALSLAQLGRTILVDANMRRPRIGHLFGLAEPVRGLDAVLSGTELLRDAIVSLPDMPTLHLLAAEQGRHNPVELLQQSAATLLMQTLVREYQYVVVDTPALESGADMRVIALNCGAAMVVARPGRSRMDDVHALVTQLRKAGVTMAGLVMNRGRGG